jgi:sialic acid synthase SpsE
LLLGLTLINAVTEVVSLGAVVPFGEITNLPYLRHSGHLGKGVIVSTGMATMGAVVIEKHSTLDRNLPGPDHKASLAPQSPMRWDEVIGQVAQRNYHGDELI